MPLGSDGKPFDTEQGNRGKNSMAKSTLPLWLRNLMVLQAGTTECADLNEDLVLI